MKQDTLAVDIQHLSFRYDRDPVLEDVSLQLEAHDFLGIVGPNGGGKTTLLKIILGFLRPESGVVRIDGQPSHKAIDKIGYVPQHVHLDLEFPISVQDVVLMGLLGQANRLGWYNRSDRQRAEQALNEVDLIQVKKHSFGHLSGGQRQRVLIARALVNTPRLLIMDEPTSHVDSLSQKQIFELLSRVNEKCTIIIVSHDLSIVPAYVKKVACLNRRLVLHPTKALSLEAIEELYHTPMQIVDHQHKV